MRLAFVIAALFAAAGLSAAPAASDPLSDLAALAGEVMAGKNPTAAELEPLGKAVRSVADALGVDPALELDTEAVAAGIKAFRLVPFEGWSGATNETPVALTASPEELLRMANLAATAAKIIAKAEVRGEEHRRKLAAKGRAELPASKAACRYRLEAGRFSCVFDRWGELFVDRRFVTRKEMESVRKFEEGYRRLIAGKGGGPHGGIGASGAAATRGEEMKKSGLPIFRGFEDDRYQCHDALIERMVASFNADKAGWIGGSAAQASAIADLTPAMVKSHMIEETGGCDPRSLAAWNADPLQVNVPGDWDEAKTEIGLTKPQRRNEGSAETNVGAAIKFLARKGFGVSGRPARTRPDGFFDGWFEALRRYNGRRDRTEQGRFYDETYSDKIIKRAKNPDLFVPVEIRLAK